jgi:hypothetical protein
MDWINIAFIESVSVSTPNNRAGDETLATICNELLELTDKLESFVIFPTLTSVWPSKYLQLKNSTLIGNLQNPFHKTANAQMD